jgi:paraquat-inducible protein B
MLTFRESVRGLTVGAPVDFRGLLVGEVRSIDAQFDRARKELSILVEIDFYPERLFRGRVRNGTPFPEGTPSLSRLVERGLRAQMRSANLLTGQHYIALDFVAGSRKVSMDVSKTPPEIPTVPGTAQELQATIASIAKKLDSIQYDRIGRDLQGTLQTATRVLNQFERDIAPAARDTMVEAKQAMVEARQALVDARKALASIERTAANAEPLPLEASDALREIGRAAQSFRVLADYLERHPEAVIRGKKLDAR